MLPSSPPIAPDAARVAPDPAGASRSGRPAPVGPWPTAPPPGVVGRALLPGVADSRRWWAGVAAAWVVGALAGVAPAAFAGYPPPGLAASALRGALGVAGLAPLVVVPLVAVIVCDDDHEQVAAAWHAVGVGPARRLALRTGAAALISLGLLPVGALAGLVAAIGLATTGADPWSPGWSGGPGPAALGLGAGLLVLAWVIGGLVAAAAVTPSRAVLVLVSSWLVTGAVASLVHFSAGLVVAFRLMPWAPLWPFDPGSSDSAQFAASIPPGTRIVVGLLWLGVLSVVAGCRRRSTPYPIPGERRRRRP